jgi:hypothetical protein
MAGFYPQTKFIQVPFYTTPTHRFTLLSLFRTTNCSPSKSYGRNAVVSQSQTFPRAVV